MNMTGRELIIYILQNNLGEVNVIENGVIKIHEFGFMTTQEAAEKFDVGISTIEAWYSLGVIKGVTNNKGVIYIFKDAKDPRCI